MTSNEMRDPCLSAIIARKVANMHCLDVPINKEPVWLFSTMAKYLASIQSRSQTEAKSVSRRHLLSFDFEKEINWLQEFLRKVSHDPTPDPESLTSLS